MSAWKPRSDVSGADTNARIRVAPAEYLWLSKLHPLRYGQKLVVSLLVAITFLLLHLCLSSSVSRFRAIELTLHLVIPRPWTSRVNLFPNIPSPLNTLSTVSIQLLNMADEEQHGSYTPLLHSDRHRLKHTSKDFLARHFVDSNPSANRIRHFLQWFLTSKYGHYFVMILVTLDVAGIFADFLISLHICEHNGEDVKVWQRINEGLDILSLVFSCLFMAELLCSIYAFGFR